MPQAGLHAIVGVLSRSWISKKEWLMLGIVLGNIFPDLDNFAVAYATLFKHLTTDQAVEMYHRTFTHSIFTILVMVILFYMIAALTKNQKWQNFGLGFGAGILMHLLVDLVLWFNGVKILWPLSSYELNFWSWFVTPPWLKILLDTGEFLAFGLYFFLLASLARQYGTDLVRRGSSKVWAYIESGLFILFTGLFFVTSKAIYHTIFGALYLISLIVAIVITIQMKQTLESTAR